MLRLSLPIGLLISLCLGTVTAQANDSADDVKEVTKAKPENQAITESESDLNIGPSTDTGEDTPKAEQPEINILPITQTYVTADADAYQDDWVKMKSGEWFRGKLKVIYEDTVEFDSDEVGLIKLDWDDIAQVRTSGIKAIKFTDQSTVVSRLLMRDQWLYLVTPKGDIFAKYPRDSMLTVASPSTHELDLWNAEIELGATFQSGNTDSVSISAIIDAKRRSVDSRNWIRYIGMYNETNEEVVEDNHRLTYTLDLFLTSSAYLRPLYTEVSSNKLTNVKYKVTVASGGGYYFTDTDLQSFTMGASLGYQHTAFDAAEPGTSASASSAVFLLNANYERELTSRIDFSFDYELQIVNQESGSNLHFLDTGFDIELINDLDFSAHMIATHTAKPAPDQNGITPEQTDTSMIFGLTYEF